MSFLGAAVFTVVAAALGIWAIVLHSYVLGIMALIALVFAIGCAQSED